MKLQLENASLELVGTLLPIRSVFVSGRKEEVVVKNFLVIRCMEY